MAETRATNPLVDQFRRGGVPKDLRMMAAQGALPLKPEDVVELRLLLTHDSDESIARAAFDGLKTMPAHELLPIVKDRSALPELLAWSLAYREERDLREAILQNTTTSDEAIESFAATLPEPLAELVVINQVRLLRRTSLLEALESNPRLNNDQRRRLRELRETFRIGEVPAEAPAPPAPPPPSPEAVAEAEAPPEAEPVDEVFASEEQAVVRYLTEDERKQGEKVSVVQKIYRMTSAEKVLTALKGNREERAILIRDPNRLIATAVLGSPRVTESEIETFAAMKNVSDEVLRQIGASRDWTRRYAIMSNLVKNPRTPLGISLGMVSRLNPRDLKSIATDRNVPDAIRKQAQRFVRATTAAPGEKR